MTYLKFGCVLVLMLCLVCGAHYYLARCIFRCVQYFFPKTRLVYVILLLCLLSAMLILSIARPFSGVPQRIISIVGVVWMGLFAYLLLYFLASDLVCLIARLFPNTPQKLRLFTEMGAITLAFLTFAFGFLHANSVRTANYSVRLAESTTSQMRVVMLSDLHIGAVNSESRLEEIVASINDQKPDLVCIAGDIFDNSYGAIIDPDGVADTLKQISAKHGVYACLGNHDSGADFEQMLGLLERAHIQLLMDKYVVIDEQLVLAGRLDPSPIGGYQGKKRQELGAVLSGADSGLPVVIMDHNPANIEEYRGKGWLVLSGHTHKGQIFPGGLITDALFTVDYGYYQAQDGAQVIVSSGAGTWGLPIRVGTDCEIVSIDLEY